MLKSDFYHRFLSSWMIRHAENRFLPAEMSRKRQEESITFSLTLPWALDGEERLLYFSPCVWIWETWFCDKSNSSTIEKQGLHYQVLFGSYSGYIVAKRSSISAIALTIDSCMISEKWLRGREQRFMYLTCLWCAWHSSKCVHIVIHSPLPLSLSKYLLDKLQGTYCIWSSVSLTILHKCLLS